MTRNDFILVNDGALVLIPLHRVLEITWDNDKLSLTVRYMHEVSATEYVKEYVEEQIDVHDCKRLREMMKLPLKEEYLVGT